MGLIDRPRGRRAQRQYLKASLDARSRPRQRRASRARGTNRATLSLKTRALVAVLALPLSSPELTVIATRRRRAAAEARVASARELAAASVANLENDQQLSVLLAMEAVRRTRSVDGSVLREAEEALHRAVTASRIVASAGSSEVACSTRRGYRRGPRGLRA